MHLQRSHIYGVMGEFGEPEELIHAVEKIRAAGYRRVNAYSPFPVEGLSEALGLKRNMVPFICMLGGLAGGVGGFFFQYWAAAITYPQNIGGRPLRRRQSRIRKTSAAVPSIAGPRSFLSPLS